MRGSCEVADVVAFGAAIRAVLASLGTPLPRFDCLSDARDFPVRLPAVAEALGMIDRVGTSIHAGRLAIVVGSVIDKLQVQRAMRPDVRTFLSMDEAEAWLDAPRP